MVDQLVRIKRLRESYWSLLPARRSASPLSKVSRTGTESDFSLGRFHDSSKQLKAQSPCPTVSLLNLRIPLRFHTSPSGAHHRGWRLQAHQFAVNDMLILDHHLGCSSTILLTAGMEGLFKIWRIADFDAPSHSSSASISNQSDPAISPLATLQMHRRSVNRISVPLNNHKQTLASCSTGLELRIWDLNSLFSADPLLAFHTDGSSTYFNSLQSCTFDATGDQLASISSEGRAHIWDLRKGIQTPTTSLSFPGSGTDVLFSPLCPMLLMTSSSSSVSLFDLGQSQKPNTTRAS